MAAQPEVELSRGHGERRQARSEATVGDGSVVTESRRSGAPGRKSQAPAVSAAARILEVLAHVSPRPVGPSELGRELGLAKSSVANVCAALADAGLARREGTRYVLGQRLAELGAAYLDGVDEIKAFHDVCSLVLPRPEETVQIATLSPGLDVSHLAQRDGRSRIQLVSDAGRNLPATCTATGKALLAYLPDDELERRLAGAVLVRMTPRSILEADVLRADLRRTRERGWAVDDEELIEGVLCLSAAVPRAKSSPLYAVSFTLLRAWATPSHCEELGELLMTIGSMIAERLGEGKGLTPSRP